MLSRTGMRQVPRTIPKIAKVERARSYLDQNLTAGRLGIGPVDLDQRIDAGEVMAIGRGVTRDQGRRHGITVVDAPRSRWPRSH